MKKFALLLLCTACSSSTEWVYRDVASRATELTSSQLYYPPDHAVVGVGVELLKGSFGTIGYLNVASRSIPPLKNEPSQAIVVFQIEEETLPYHAQRMEGGQRLILPEEATEKLITSLQEGIPVTINLESYRSKIEPARFQKALKKFGRSAAHLSEAPL